MSEQIQTTEELGQVELLKRQLAQTRRELRDVAVMGAGERAIIDALETLIPSRPEVPPARARKLGKTAVRMSGILDIGDVHFGELVSGRSTGGVAEYSPDIARERFDHTIDEAIRLGKENNVRTMWLVGGGDMISGNIHDDLNRNNEMMTIGQTLECAEMMYGGIEKLCQAFPEVHFVGVSGNHARTEKIPFFNHKQTENLDYMLYKILEMKGKDQKNLDFHTPDSFWQIIDVEDRKFMVMHGDTIKQQNSMSLPFYGMWKEFMKFKALESTIGHFDDMIVHHQHVPVAITVGEGKYYGNGALKGKDDYSLAGSRLPAPAAQRFLTVAAGAVVGDFMISSEHIQGGPIEQT